ncbi:MAG: D-alanine--D-alanine ligase [Chloroflexi bacterium]|nr:MAG: D-alanine--D-alanine ligase [Chloroflexota bacterium]
MKALLLHCPEIDCIKKDEERFYGMISALNRGGVIGIYYSLHAKPQIPGILLLERPDIVFSADYYALDESNERQSIHKILYELQVPYIGSTPEALELVLSKSDLKEKWQSHKVATPQFFTIKKNDIQVSGLESLLGATEYPYILKPDREGNSRGLDESSIVFDQISLESKLRELLETYEEVLIEKYLGNCSDFREFTVAMIGNGQRKLLMPAEITLKRKKSLRIITTKDKEEHHTQAIPVDDKTLLERLIELAERAFEIAGVRDYSRCDVIMADGQLFAIEINGQPMIPDKWFEVCASGVGLDSSQYINAIFLAGIVRNIEQGISNLIIPSEMRQHLPSSIFNMLTKSR